MNGQAVYLCSQEAKYEIFNDGFFPLTDDNLFRAEYLNADSDRGTIPAYD